MIFNQETKKWESIYWHPAVAVDAVVFGYDFGKQNLSVLLIERGLEPFKGCWALPGGFLKEDDKTAKDAILRELKEETNAEVLDPIEFQTFSEIDRDPRPNDRVISIAFYALVDQKKYHEIKGGDDATNARWFSINELPKLAFDHGEIVKAAYERLTKDVHFEPIVFQLLDEEFTIPQVQSIYKAILRPEPIYSSANDNRNFMKKILKLGYVRATGKRLQGCSYRPPMLYTLDEEAYRNAKRMGMRLEF